MKSLYRLFVPFPGTYPLQNVTTLVRLFASTSSSVFTSEIPLLTTGSPASHLRVFLPNIKGSITVQAHPEGPHISDRIRLSASASTSAPSASPIHPDSILEIDCEAGNRVAILERPGGVPPPPKRPSYRTPFVPALAADLTLSIPHAYCTVEIVTGGGDVRVDRIKEAALAVDSRGGSIHLGTIAGSSVFLSAHEGTITCAHALTAARIALATSRGDIRLRKVLGRDVLIKTGAGAVDLGFLAGDRLSVETGARSPSLTIRSLFGFEAATVRSLGPRTVVDVEGVEGRAEVSSAGGETVVSVHDRVECLRVEAEGPGGVEVRVPRTLRAELDLTARGGVVAVAEALTGRVKRAPGAATAADSFVGRLAAESVAQMRAQGVVPSVAKRSMESPSPTGAGAGPAGASVVVRAGAGGVALAPGLSVFDQLRARTRAKILQADAEAAEARGGGGSGSGPILSASATEGGRELG